ncbi:MAG: hypothetical protein PVF43_08345, partial [Candidatus Eiseniibacteriota bacterium]
MLLLLAILLIAAPCVYVTPAAPASPTVRHVRAADGETLIEVVPRTVVVGDRVVDTLVGGDAGSEGSRRVGTAPAADVTPAGASRSTP